MRATTRAGLIDRNFGPWEGKPRKLVEDRYGTIDNAPAAEIEPQAEVARRAVAAWDALTRNCPEQSLAIVTHEAVIKALDSAATIGTVETRPRSRRHSPAGTGS